jgi:hypothetical protein
LSSRRGLGVLVGLVTLVLLASGPALADHEEAAVSLEPGESVAIAIDNADGEDLWLEYEVNVLAGPEVDVWFTDEEGYTQFYTPSEDFFTYYPDHSIEGTSYANESWAWSERGLFYLIIDNDSGDEGVNVQYTVDWEPYSFSILLVASLIAIILVVMVTVVILVFYTTLKRAQAKEEELKVEEARAEDVGTEWDEGRPRPPTPYPEWVVEASMRDLTDDDATGWDPSRDEPRD